jgi:hypothetical protein
MVWSDIKIVVRHTFSLVLRDISGYFTAMDGNVCGVLSLQVGSVVGLVE